MKHLEPEDFDNTEKNTDKKIVLFYADWCPYCSKFKPIYEEKMLHITSKETNLIKNEFGAFVSKVNDDENPLWDRFSINSIPTIIAFDGNKIITRQDAKMGIGLTKNDLDQLLRDLHLN